ncbi:hypothetical protein ACFXP3_01625 [Streptomyces sp. NPDC059096]|uniref:hypothetical protein n=1 Tax=Streptomyces sp. NPDC059096 TaxID=3346727 RepID=UPI00369AE55C
MGREFQPRSSNALGDMELLRGVLVVLRADLLMAAPPEPGTEEIERVCAFVLGGVVALADAEEAETLCLALRRYVTVLVERAPSGVDEWSRSRAVAVRRLHAESVQSGASFYIAVRLARICLDLLRLVDAPRGRHGSGAPVGPVCRTAAEAKRSPAGLTHLKWRAARDIFRGSHVRS